ncbi:MAG: mycofactocin-associated electron transfer flavoprotein beta subunit [Ilumatobacteraceae bacterium]
MIAACLKWTAPPGDESDDRFAGVSAADLAALEVALRLGESLDVPVVAVASGPVGAERALRDALACGASRAVRIEAPADADSRDVAFELAQATADASIVVCGDYSLDRGSGSVPAFVAHHRRAAQALGLVQIDFDRCHLGAVHALRRLDGGRREVLTVPTPCVLSVEGSVASLRRAGLKQSLAARTAAVEVRVSPPPHHHTVAAIITPYRPRARVLPSPHGDDALSRLRAITDLGAAPARGETIELEPRAAAERIAAALRDWGYLP